MNSNTKKPEKEFVTYEQALALKKLGFNEECLEELEHRKLCSNREQPGGCQLHNLHCSYPNCTIDKTIEPIPLPLKQQVFRWFREKYDLHHIVIWDSDTNNFDAGLFGELVVPFLKDTIFPTYEEAENACIDKLIEIAKQQDND
jgi:hypothetical protein